MNMVLKKMRVILLLGLMGLWMGVPVLKGQSEEKETILILNSDGSVPKYLIAQKSFSEAMSQAELVTVDLKATPLSSYELKRKIAAVRPDAIYCIGSQSYVLASKVERRRPIVLSSAINWQRFANQKNTLVVASELPIETQLTLFRYFFPGVRRIGVLYSSDFNAEWVAQAGQLAPDMGLEVVAREVKEPDDVATQLDDLLLRVDALWITADPLVLSSGATVKGVFQKTDAMKKPVFSYSPAFAPNSALVIAPDVPTIGRQAAGMLQAHKNKERTNEKFQTPAGSEVTLNLRVITKYGIEYNEEAMDAVNNIIR